MTFSFDPALSTDRDKVRFRIGDVVDAGHLVENETITALLTSTGDPGLTSVQIAKSIAAKYASKVDKAIGSTRLAMSQAFEHWRDLAREIAEEGGAMDGSGVATVDPPYVGGISESERTDFATGDADRIQPSFSIGQDDIDANATPLPPYKTGV